MRPLSAGADPGLPLAPAQNPPPQHLHSPQPPFGGVDSSGEPLEGGRIGRRVLLSCSPPRRAIQARSGGRVLGRLALVRSPSSTEARASSLPFAGWGGRRGALLQHPEVGRGGAPKRKDAREGGRRPLVAAWRSSGILPPAKASPAPIPGLEQNRFRRLLGLLKNPLLICMRDGLSL